MPLENIHATAILVRDRGILIMGPSGSGKTTLALALIGHFQARHVFSRLVGDDQLFVEATAGRVVAHAPKTIAGLAEVAGIGPQPVAFESAAVIDLVVRLVAEDQMQRLQPEASEIVAGCAIRRFDLAARNVASALQVVAAHLVSRPFG